MTCNARPHHTLSPWDACMTVKHEPHGKTQSLARNPLNLTCTTLCEQASLALGDALSCVHLVLHQMQPPYAACRPLQPSCTNCSQLAAWPCMPSTYRSPVDCYQTISRASTSHSHLSLATTRCPENSLNSSRCSNTYLRCAHRSATLGVW